MPVERWNQKQNKNKKQKEKQKQNQKEKKYDNDEQIKNVLIKYRRTIYYKIDIYFLKFVIYFSCNWIWFILSFRL